MAQEDIYLTQGATWSASLGATNSTTGAATSLSGGTVVLSCRWTPQTSPVIFTCSSGDGITITDAAGGLFTLEIAGSKTAVLPNYPLTLYYEILFTDSSAKPWNIMSGHIVVSPSV